MNFNRKFLFPAIGLGCLMIIIFSSAISDPRPVNAANIPPQEESPTGEPATCAITGRYPQAIQQWCAIITRYAIERGLDPNLVAAVVLQESGGNSEAFSASGAVGLMQVMPRDGIAAAFMCINGPCFANRPTIAELFNPEFNLNYGTGMLAGLMSKFGNIRDALKSYGPMDVGYYYADLVLTIYEQNQ